MYTLYIDTHFVELVVALFLDDNLVCKKELKSNSHSEFTINTIRSVLEEENITVKDLESIIVINGPGSFTGVRIGVVIAKTLAYTLNIPVKTLSYLEALSLNYQEDVVIGLEDRNGVYVGSFDKLHDLKEDYYYVKKQDMSRDVILDEEVPLEKVIRYMKDKEAVNPHLLKPLYVKRIEVEHD